VPSGRVCGSLRGNGKVLATACEPIPWAAPTTSMWHWCCPGDIVVALMSLAGSDPMW